MMHYIDNAGINKAPVFIFSNGGNEFKHKMLDVDVFM